MMTVNEMDFKVFDTKRMDEHAKLPSKSMMNELKLCGIIFL